MTGRVQAAIEELRFLTTCRCDAAWTERGLHERECVSDYREDLDVLLAALNAPARGVSS